MTLLNSVLCADYMKEEEAEEKALAKAAKDDVAPRKTQVSLASMAGGDGISYLEYAAESATEKRMRLQKSVKRHKLFKSRKVAR